MKKLFILLFLVALTSLPSFAQFGSIGSVDARSMGMAKAYTTTTAGVYSIGINPANLMFKKDGEIDFATVLPIPSVSFRGGTDFMSLDEVNYYFGGVDGNSRVLVANDKVELNNLFQDGGFIFGNAGARFLSISYKNSSDVGAFGFSMHDYAGGKFNFPQAIVDVALSGNPIGKIYNMDDAKVKMWWIRNYSLTYARDLNMIRQSLFDQLSAGISLKLVQGFAFVGTENVNTVFETQDQNVVYVNADLLAYTAFSDDLGVKYEFEDEDKEQNIGPFMSPVGSGFGVDLGFSAKKDFWTFGLAITDIGGITWDENTAEYSSIGSIYFDDITDDAQVDSLEDKILGSAKPIGSFSTGLATALRLGASYLFASATDDIPGTLLVALDYNQGFNDLPGNSKSPRFSVGAEWKPGAWIPFIRTGIGVGGTDGFNWAFGLGVDIADLVELHFSTSALQSFVAPNAANRISIGLGSRWKIN